VVHQEADGAELHAVHRDAEAAVAMQGLQHETVAAERTEDVGFCRCALAVPRSHGFQRLLGVGAGAGEEGDALLGHGCVLSGGSIPQARG